jgi:hypothetical protein
VFSIVCEKDRFGTSFALSIAVLRITATTTDKEALKLEGRLVGPWVEELRKTVSGTGDGQGLEIDVRDLTFADEEGERALRWLHRLGVRFHGRGSFSNYLFARLRIPLHAQSAEFDRNSRPASGCAGHQR